MPQFTLSPVGVPLAIPVVDWTALDDAALASWVVWLNTDLDLWLSGERGYLPKGTDEDLLCAAYAERERRQEVRLERAS